MEETWELTAVSLDWRQFGSGTLTVAIFFLIASILISLLTSLYRKKFKKFQTIGLEALTAKERKEAREAISALSVRTEMQIHSYSSGKVEKSLEEFKDFNKRFPDYVLAIDEEVETRGPARDRAENLMALGVILIVISAVFFSKYIQTKFIVNIPVFQTSITEEALDISEGIQRQTLKVTKIIDVFNDGSDFSVEQISDAAISLPIELRALEGLLKNQKNNNQKLLQLVETERLELERLRLQQSAMAKLTDDELESVKVLIFSESRESAFNFFWVGIFITFLIQLFILFIQTPLLNAIGKTRLGRKVYGQGIKIIDGGEF